MDWASLDCDSWTNSFASNGIVYLPGAATGVETYIGQAQIAAYCAKHKSVIAGSGAYPHDMYISNDGSRAIFNLHIRALSHDNCHIDWPSILQVQIDAASQKIVQWSHYFDGEWMAPMINCKKNEIVPATTAAPLHATLKSMTYEALLSFTSNCTDFALRFTPTIGSLQTPVGGNSAVGFSQVLNRCNAVNGWFQGAGNYAHDFYLGDNRVVFFWHIRAITAQCHVNWPGIVVMTFDGKGKIANFEHFWDEDWTMAAVNCNK